MATTPFALPGAVDLDEMHAAMVGQWTALRGKRVFMTGGTGFVGKWLLAALTDADKRDGLGCSVTVLTRDAANFRRACPALAQASCVTLLEADVRDFDFADAQFDYVVHAATDVSSPGSALDIFDSCVLGTRRVLEFAVRAGAGKVLLVSSGAVYGRQPPDLFATPESWTQGPDPLAAGSVYAEAKRAAECLAAIHSRNGLDVTIARCFAFVGPYLPLDKHFAIGNFIAAALAGTPIEIRGDGTPLRSYMYASEMSAWLWTILLRGRTGAAYNVGGEMPVSIAGLAARTAAVLNPELPISIAQQRATGAPAERYVPDTSLARDELGLTQGIGLDEAILRTANWYRENRK